MFIHWRHSKFFNRAKLCSDLNLRIFDRFHSLRCPSITSSSSPFTTTTTTSSQPLPSSLDDALNSSISTDHKNSGLRVLRQEGKGRILMTTLPLQKCDVVFSEEPLIAVESPFRTDSTCSVCFLSINKLSTITYGCNDCGSKFCSKECQVLALGAGTTHDVLCGGTGKPADALFLLNSFCKEHNLNFPRVAAAAVAKSLTNNNFENFWVKTNRLASLSLGAEETLPASFTTSYSLVKDAVSRGLGGDTDAFFTHAFNLRAYARFMGTLRLNAFSVQCPLDGDAKDAIMAAESAASASSTTASGCCGTTPNNFSDTFSSSSSSSSSSSTSSSSCGSDPSSCSSHEHDDVGTILRAAERSPGSGTALYATASLLNHDCNPNLDVHMSRGGQIAFVARRDIKADEELSITYIDANLETPERLRALRHGYGFDCKCERCGL